MPDEAVLTVNLKSEVPPEPTGRAPERPEAPGKSPERPEVPREIPTGPPRPPATQTPAAPVAPNLPEGVRWEDLRHLATLLRVPQAKHLTPAELVSALQKQGVDVGGISVAEERTETTAELPRPPEITTPAPAPAEPGRESERPEIPGAEPRPPAEVPAELVSSLAALTTAVEAKDVGQLRATERRIEEAAPEVPPAEAPRGPSLTTPERPKAPDAEFWETERQRFAALGKVLDDFEPPLRAAMEAYLEQLHKAAPETWEAAVGHETLKSLRGSFDLTFFSHRQYAAAVDVLTREVRNYTDKTKTTRPAELKPEAAELARQLGITPERKPQAPAELKPEAAPTPPKSEAVPAAIESDLDKWHEEALASQRVMMAEANQSLRSVDLLAELAPDLRAATLDFINQLQQAGFRVRVPTREDLEPLLGSFRETFSEHAQYDSALSAITAALREEAARPSLPPIPPAPPVPSFFEPAPVTVPRVPEALPVEQLAEPREPLAPSLPAIPLAEPALPPEPRPPAEPVNVPLAPLTTAPVIPLAETPPPRGEVPLAEPPMRPREPFPVAPPIELPDVDPFNRALHTAADALEDFSRLVAEAMPPPAGAPLPPTPLPGELTVTALAPPPAPSPLGLPLVPPPPEPPKPPVVGTAAPLPPEPPVPLAGPSFPVAPPVDLRTAPAVGELTVEALPPPVPPPGSPERPIPVKPDYQATFEEGRRTKRQQEAVGAMVGAAELKEAEEEKERQKAQRQKVFQAYRDLFGGPSPQEVGEVQRSRREGLDRMAHLGTMASIVGLPGGQAAGKVAVAASAGSELGGAVGGILGGGAGALAGGPIGMAVGASIAVVQMIGKTIEAGLREAFTIGTAIVSLNAERFGRALGDLAGKIPVVGGILGTLTGGLFDMLEGVRHTAENLSQYNADIAMQVAEFDLRNMERDMRRAEEFGPQIMEAMESRQELMDTIHKLMDDLMPTFLEIAKTLAEWVKDGVNDIRTMVAMLGIIKENFLTILEYLPGTQELVRQLRAINRNTEPQPIIPAADRFIQALFNLERPEEAARRGARERGDRGIGPGGVVPGFGNF